MIANVQTCRGRPLPGDWATPRTVALTKPAWPRGSPHRQETPCRLPPKNKVIKFMASCLPCLKVELARGSMWRSPSSRTSRRFLMALVASPSRLYSSFMRGYTPCRDFTSNSVWKCDTMQLSVCRVGLRSTWDTTRNKCWFCYEDNLENLDFVHSFSFSWLFTGDWTRDQISTNIHPLQKCCFIFIHKATIWCFFHNVKLVTPRFKFFVQMSEACYWLRLTPSVEKWQQNE